MEVQGGGRISLIRRIAKNPRVLSVLTVGCMLAFGVMYVAQVNSSATKGYAVRTLESQNRTLQQENDRLAMQIAKLRSVDSVKTRAAFLSLKPIAPAIFVKTNTNVVAVR